MAELVMFPDTDRLARQYLLTGLAEHGVTGIAVGTKLPSPMQNRFIRCYSIPGRQLCRRTQTCQIVVQAYDTKQNDVRCSHLARLCASILEASPDMEVDGAQPFSRPAEVQGPYPYEDPDLPGVPRYQVLVFVTVQSAVSD
jgi:hypothetical protein